ncbi:hypothetical protein E2C01_064324 [Portunus trituberculatus]|uniref:Uncharacterized protein n=1 Tax=Portunus trituberculatus TaxID=210409 RepID=A0A5B7HLH0_PORTR|nr:hypothetical protein [Portunus trituberculatus]
MPCCRNLEEGQVDAITSKPAEQGNCSSVPVRLSGATRTPATQQHHFSNTSNTPPLRESHGT